jgi:hypothetical protein
VSLGTTLGELAGIFDRDHYALVVAEQVNYSGGAAGVTSVRSVVTGIVTRIDLLNFISKKPKDSPP